MVKLQFNDADIQKIIYFFESNLPANELFSLIEKFPKLFCRLLREFKQGQLTTKLIDIDHNSSEKIMVIPGEKKILLKYVQDPFNGNFSKAFSHLSETLYENIEKKDQSQDQYDSEHHSKTRKSLMECGFNQNVIDQVNTSVKEEWFLFKNN